MALRGVFMGWLTRDMRLLNIAHMQGLTDAFARDFCEDFEGMDRGALTRVGEAMDVSE